VNLQRAAGVIALISVQTGRTRTIHTDCTIQPRKKGGHDFQDLEFSKFVVHCDFS